MARSTTVPPAVTSISVTEPVLAAIASSKAICRSLLVATPVAPSAGCEPAPSTDAAAVSRVTVRADDSVPALPTASVIRALIALSPSLPRSPSVTARSTNPVVMSVPVRMAVTGVVRLAPPSSSSTVSPARAPVPDRDTRKVGAVALVRSSPVAPPVSEPSTRSGAAGAAGPVLSRVYCSPPVKPPSPAPVVPAPPRAIPVPELMMLSLSTTSRPTAPSSDPRSPPDTVTV